MFYHKLFFKLSSISKEACLTGNSSANLPWELIMQLFVSRLKIIILWFWQVLKHLVTKPCETKQKYLYLSKETIFISWNKTWGVIYPKCAKCGAFFKQSRINYVREYIDELHCVKIVISWNYVYYLTIYLIYSWSAVCFSGRSMKDNENLRTTPSCPINWLPAPMPQSSLPPNVHFSWCRQWGWGSW